MKDYNEISQFGLQNLSEDTEFDPLRHSEKFHYSSKYGNS